MLTLQYPSALLFVEFPWFVQHLTERISLEIVFPEFVWHRVLERYCCFDQSGEVGRAVSYLSTSRYSCFFVLLVARHVRSSWHCSVTYMPSNSLEAELYKPLWRLLWNWSRLGSLSLIFFPTFFKGYDNSFKSACDFLNLCKVKLKVTFEDLSTSLSILKLECVWRMRIVQSIFFKKLNNKQIIES